jgi:hypothetical protein
MLIIYAITNSIIGSIKKKKFGHSDQKISLLTLVAFHSQILVGIVLYISSPKVEFVKDMFQIEVLRFFTLEHGLLMLISATLITIGYSKAKRHNDSKGHQNIFIFYLLALLIILWAIPWPFKTSLGGSWI